MVVKKKRYQRGGGEKTTVLVHLTLICLADFSPVYIEGLKTDGTC